jgi:hypothetical protein
MPTSASAPETTEVDAEADISPETITNAPAQLPATSTKVSASSKKRKSKNKKKRNAKKHARKLLQNLLNTYIALHAPNGCVIEDQFGVPLIILVRYIFGGEFGKKLNVSFFNPLVIRK